MTSLRFPLALACAGTLLLGACVQPGSTVTPAGQNTQQGALIGAGVGAVAGALVGNGDDRVEGALVGAALGTAVGAGIGYSLDKQEADLRRELGNQNVQITNTGDRLIVTLPQDILFAKDSFAVRPDLQRDLYTVAGNLQQYPASTIQIVGHTDSDGEAAYNQQLSERRANAVAGVLINAGVTPQRIRTIGQGENAPVASNLTPEGKAQNRRVEIIILPNA
jgi:outer membrane protein OmpA-like peptidoglycan-associated protein